MAGHLRLVLSLALAVAVGSWCLLRLLHSSSIADVGIRIWDDRVAEID